MEIYLDHAATTPVHREVVAAMLPYWTDHYGNSSSLHQFGQRARMALEQSRESIAAQINAQPKEVIFTGCGSESDNLALRGVLLGAEKGSHLITSCIEHQAVLATARQLSEYHDFELTVLPVDEWGRVSVADVMGAIRPKTTLISIMAANNEIGTIQPIAEIGQLARDHGILFHTDAVQAISHQAWDMSTMPIDLLSIAPHKFGGPKGVGVLYVRDGVTLLPSMTGGSQENGLRPGTTNVAFAVGAARALLIAQTNETHHTAHCLRLRDQLITSVLDAFPDECRLTGHPTERLPHHASFTFRHLRGNDLLMHLDLHGIAASSGSACSVGNPKPSRILQALGLSEAWTSGGLRFSMGAQNTIDEIDYTLEKLSLVVKKLQKLAKYR